MSIVVEYKNTAPSPPVGLQNVHWQKGATDAGVQIISITGDLPGPYTIETAAPHGFADGDIVFVQGGSFQPATGTWVISAVSGNFFNVPGWPDGAVEFRESSATIAVASTKISAYMVPMVGATGASPPDGLSGAVPQPQPGDVSPMHFLAADGTWRVPGGTGSAVTGYEASFSAATSVTVTHSLGTRRVVVQVWSLIVSPPILVEAEEVAIVDANTVSLAFGAATTGFVVVMGF